MELTKGTEVRTVTFAYDPFGRRIGKTFTIKRGVTTLVNQSCSYVYDDEDIALEVFTPTSGPQEKTFFIQGPGIDEPLALVRNNQYYTYHADALGSIYAIADSSHNVVERYSYDTYGKPTPQTGFRNSYTYVGKEWDKEIALYKMGVRGYDPFDGRFISRDPISFAGGDVNLWNYTSNNPVNFIDPYGYSATTIVGTWISTDLAIPEVTDLAWPKWVGYGLALGGAAVIDWLIFKDHERGLPPKGVFPPVKNPKQCKPGPASRPSEGKKGGKSLWDPKGGEWRYFPEDKWHNPHWDYNPHNKPKSPWQNIPINGLPPRK